MSPIHPTHGHMEEAAVMLLRFLALAFLVAGLSPAQSANRNFDIPVLVPVTGFLALEGTAQRNGALLALATPLAGIITTPRGRHLDLAGSRG